MGTSFYVPARAELQISSARAAPQQVRVGRASAQISAIRTRLRIRLRTDVQPLGAAQ